MATSYTITKRAEWLHGLSIDELDLREADEVDSEFVIQRRNINPFLIDFERRQLMFAELPSDVDLRDEAFAGAAQARLASRLIGIPFDELSALAAEVPRPAGQIIIPCTSRSGTTLLHRIFNRVEGIASFAELSIFVNARFLDELGLMEQDELVPLLSSCLRLQTWPHAASRVVFKLRALETPAIRLFNAVLPGSDNVMIYRNAIDWTASWWRFHLEWCDPMEFTIDEMSARYGIVPETRNWLATWIEASSRTKVPAVIAILAMWIDCVDAYLDAHTHGLRAFTLRYEDLNAAPSAMIEKLFDHLDISRTHLGDARAAFAEDSQKGTEMARQDGRPNEVVLDPAQIELIEEVLSMHPRRLSASMLLPGTTLLE
jgi:hypothetical protein